VSPIQCRWKTWTLPGSSRESAYWSVLPPNQSRSNAASMRAASPPAQSAVAAAGGHVGEVAQAAHV
jgi:hypothetical protein